MSGLAVMKSHSISLSEQGEKRGLAVGWQIRGGGAGEVIRCSGSREMSEACEGEGG